MRVRTENLTKTFRLGLSEITAVNNVSFEVDEAKFTTIVGRSGSGKSTLLNLIGLNDVPTSGKVFIDDTDVFSLSAGKRRSIRLRRMGFVFQTFNLLPTLDAVENVELPMALASKPKREQREKAAKLLSTVGLEGRFSHRPKQLSMGEMQRVAIARALANDPEIVIADEPTGELDSKTAEEIIVLLFEICKTQKKTVLVATHDENVVEIADAIQVMQDGELSPRERLPHIE
jgi:putative ABC transport system ATP-binding protein